jgi:hypothetical protein
MEVALVRWPQESSRLDALREGESPRLVLVEPDAQPPLTADCLEDWVRMPADDADIQARVRMLELRQAEHAPDRPELDENGVLRRGAAWVALPPVEARLFSALLDRMGRVTTRNDLNAAGWPVEAPDRNVLDVHILHLRRKTAPLGLAIRTIRSRGYLLEAVNAPPVEPLNGNGASAPTGLVTRR